MPALKLGKVRFHSHQRKASLLTSLRIVAQAHAPVDARRGSEGHLCMAAREPPHPFDLFIGPAGFKGGSATNSIDCGKAFAMGSGGRRLTDEEEREVRRELAELRQEHRDLDAAILALADQPEKDTIRLQRLKKRKLYLKDRIASLDDRLLPDIIA